MQPDRAAIAAFVDAVFLRSNPEGYISLRAFHDLEDGKPPLFTEAVKVGASDLVDRVCARIAETANHPEPHVFCPPVCTFKTANGAKAEDLAEGVALSADLDERPQAALAKLTAILGAPTASVATGGIWLNPATGKPEAKLHAHWRLAQPTRTAEEHARLYEARELAADLVDADRTAVAIVHPLRWPGSWHCKDKPRIARGRVADIEIDLGDALDLLRDAVGLDAHHRAGGGEQHRQHRPRGERADIESAMAVIPNPDLPWNDWNRIGMALWAATDGQSYTAFDSWSRQSRKYDSKATDARWQHYAKSPPSRIGAGTIFFEADRARPGWRQQNKGGKANGQQKAKEAPQPVHDWGDPDWSILDDRRGDLPDFPLDVLSKETQELVKRSATGAGVTAAHVAVPLLGVVSSLIGTACRVQATTSWLQATTCWTVVVGFSGTGRTSGINVTRRTLNQIERNNRDKIAEKQRAHNTKREAAEATRKNWEKLVKEASEAKLPVPPMPVEATDPGKFIAPKLYVSDGTIERLAELLQARPQGMLLLRDELAALFGNMSRYSGGEDNEFWLESWNGDSYVVERMGRTLHVDHLLYGIVGGMQPDKLRKSFEGDQDGMYARVLFAWPTEPACPVLSDDAPEIESGLQSAIGFINDRLAALTDGNLVPQLIPLDAEARERFAQFLQFAHQGKDALEGREREWWAKMSAHVLRIAGTLTFLTWAMEGGGARPTAISDATMQSAIRLVRDYFWPHARACLRQIGLSERHVNARTALRWIIAKRKREVSREEIRREALSQQLDAQQTADLLASLCNSGWLKEEKAESGPQGGKPVRRWLVNQKLFTNPTAETAETAETPS